MDRYIKCYREKFSEVFNENIVNEHSSFSISFETAFTNIKKDHPTIAKKLNNLKKSPSKYNLLKSLIYNKAQSNVKTPAIHYMATLLTSLIALSTSVYITLFEKKDIASIFIISLILMFIIWSGRKFIFTIFTIFTNDYYSCCYLGILEYIVKEK